METVERVGLFGNLFYVCLVIAAIGLILAVIFFISFDIPAMFALKTGRPMKSKSRKKPTEGKTGTAVKLPAYSEGLTARTSGGLNSTPGEQKAEILQPDMLPQPETTLLASVQQPETTLLTYVQQPEDDPEPQAGVTAPLVREQKDITYPFTVTKSIVLIHTDEII